MVHYQERFYRTRIASSDWVSFTVQVKESDLWIRARRDLAEEAYERLFRHRQGLEEYIRQHPEFEEALTPLPPDPLAPAIIRDMLAAGRTAGVGPMAAVAGAVAQYVGNDLLALSSEIIIENGGDLFIFCRESLTVGLFAGASPLSQRIGVSLPPAAGPVGLCTSSGTVGHSLSFGRADAVTVLSSSAILADAAATAVGNRVRTRQDLSEAIAFAQTIPGVDGVLIVLGDQLGLWGDLEIVSL
jgi:ApbE superfamily uncharacterized protein (UPF0280 family)